MHAIILYEPGDDVETSDTRVIATGNFYELLERLPSVCKALNRVSGYFSPGRFEVAGTMVSNFDARDPLANIVPVEWPW